jgi:hypothetical protein
MLTVYQSETQDWIRQSQSRTENRAYGPVLFFLYFNT